MSVGGLLIAVFALHALFALAVGTHGWDDGAITMGYANTFADTGRIALTPPSEVVEGFSSPLWFLLLAGTYRLIPLDFGGMILAAQLWTAFFAAVGAAVLYALLRPVLTRSAWLVSLLVFASFLSETANGMEMTALSALALATVRALQRPATGAIVLLVLGGLAPWVRLEAGGYVIVGALVLFAMTRDVRRAGLIAAGAFMSMIVLSGLRLAIFGSLLPNTMLAKRWPPYLESDIAQRWYIVVELAFVLAPAAILVTIGVMGNWHWRRPTTPPASAYILGYLIAVAGFNLVVGKNWGYLGRMEQSVVAVTVVLVVYAAPRTMQAIESRWRLATAVILLLALTLFGLKVQGMGWPLGRTDGTTPAATRNVQLAAEDIRARLDLPTASVLIADVGGAGLCCKKLRILDLALLTNRELARNGYSALPGLIDRERPDIIGTHGEWSTITGVYALDSFRKNYTPVRFKKLWMWFYVRNDHIAALDCHPTDAAPADPIDRAYVRSVGKVCALE